MLATRLQDALVEGKLRTIYVVHWQGRDWRFDNQSAARSWANEKLGDPKAYRKVKSRHPANENLDEAKGDAGPLSKVKKKPAPHMWFIAKTGPSAWVVSIGDPTKTSSKTKRTFHSKDDLRYWVKYEKEVSNDHIIDRSGLKLVPDYYSQWYVDNMMKGK